MTTPHFVYPVAVSLLPPQGRVFELEAPREALTEISERLGVPSVLRLAASVHLRATARGAALSGRIDARLVRTCVRSLEAMEETVSEEFAVDFVRGDAAAFDEAAAEAEPLPDDEIDLAEILVQELSLAMAPYPSREEAEEPARQENKVGSPFHVLERLIAPGRDAE
jgi:uncharacterized metal-binding protein YceD (DUF177 family)